MQDLMPLKTMIDAKYPGKLADCGIAVMPDGSRILRFTAAATSGDQAAMQSDANAFVFPPAMDVPSFESALFHDTTVPLLTRLEMAGYFPLLRTHTDAIDRKNFWAALKGYHSGAGGYLNGNCTDGVSIVTRIETYAAQFGCPLV